MQKTIRNNDINDLCNSLKIEMIYGRPRYLKNQVEVGEFDQALTRYCQKKSTGNDLNMIINTI